MSYRLDVVAEKLIQALCELVVLRERELIEPSSIEATILHDALEDLAKGLGAHLGLPPEAEPPSASVASFAKAVRECHSTLDVARVFQDVASLQAYLITPYFGASDLRRLQEGTGSPPETGG